MNENEVKQWRDQAEKFRKGECVLCAWGGKRVGKTDPDSVTEQEAAELGATFPFVDKHCFVPSSTFCLMVISLCVS